MDRHRFLDSTGLRATPSLWALIAWLPERTTEEGGERKMAVQDLDLPSSDPVRWSPYRKASLVNDIDHGTISFDEACERYQPSSAELLGWQGAMLWGRFP